MGPATYFLSPFFKTPKVLLGFSANCGPGTIGFVWAQIINRNWQFMADVHLDFMAFVQSLRQTKDMSIEEIYWLAIEDKMSSFYGFQDTRHEL